MVADTKMKIEREASEKVKQLCARHEKDIKSWLAEMHEQQRLLLESSCRKLATHITETLVEQQPRCQGPGCSTDMIDLFCEGEKEKKEGDDMQREEQTPVDPFGASEVFESKSESKKSVTFKREDEKSASSISTPSEPMAASHSAKNQDDADGSLVQAENSEPYTGRSLQSSTGSDFLHRSENVDQFHSTALANMRIIKRDAKLGTWGTKSKFSRFGSTLSSLFTSRQLVVHACKVISKHRHFDTTVNMMIFCNCIVMAVVTDHYARTHQDSTAPWARPLDIFFTVFFCLDLFIRVIAQNRKFLTKSKDRWWNALDVCVVVITIVEEILTLISLEKGANVKFVRIIRLLRLVKGFRVLRAARSLSALRVLVVGITQSVSPLFWAICLLVLFTFVFAILFTQSVAFSLSEHYEDNSQTVVEIDVLFRLQKNFGSIVRSMNTLIQTITGGIDWGVVSDDLFMLSTWCGIAFLSYIAFGIFILTNVITGVFLCKAVENAADDNTNILICDAETRGKHLKSVGKFFSKADLDGDGYLNIHEFSSHFGHPCVEAYFRFLGINYEGWSPESLFTVFDLDGDGLISVDEFVYGCSTLKGTAQRLDVAQMTFVLRRKLEQLNLLLTKIVDEETNHSSLLTKVVDEETKNSSRVKLLSSEVREVVRSASRDGFHAPTTFFKGGIGLTKSATIDSTSSCQGEDVVEVGGLHTSITAHRHAVPFEKSQHDETAVACSTMQL